MQTYFLISTILCLIITIVYNTYIIIKYKKIPESLSETSYLLGGNKRYFFTGYCIIVCLLLLPILMGITFTNYQIIPFIFCCGLSFAGCSPLFSAGLDRPIHYIFSILAFIAYIFYMIFCMGWIWLIGYLIVLGILCAIKWRSYVYWAEIIAVLEIIIFILCCYI